MKRSPMPRSQKPMKRTELKRNTRIKPINSKRRKRLHAEQYGDKAPWVRQQGCQLARWSPTHVCEGHIVAAHAVKTRGAGGKEEHLVGWCYAAEREFHAVGRHSFADLHGVDLELMTSVQHSEWLEVAAA